MKGLYLFIGWLLGLLTVTTVTASGGAWTRYDIARVIQLLEKIASQ